MDATRRYNLVQAGLFLLVVPHALWTWPLADVLALFVGGAAVAVVSEVVVVRAGMLRHHVHPQVAGVPLTVVLAWPAVVYVAVRIADLLVSGAVAVAAVAAVLGTANDVLVDPDGVADGAWEYPEHPLSRPRYRDVPLWNFAGWLAIVFVTALLPAAV